MVPKTTRHDQRKMFVKMSLRDRLDCLVDFVGITLLCLLTPCLPAVRKLHSASSFPPTAHFRMRLPSPNCFLRVCHPTFSAAVLKFFLPLTISANSGTANSNKSAPTRFVAGRIYLRKNGIAVLPITCASALNPRPHFRPTPL